MKMKLFVIYSLGALALMLGASTAQTIPPPPAAETPKAPADPLKEMTAARDALQVQLTGTQQQAQLLQIVAEKNGALAERNELAVRLIQTQQAQAAAEADRDRLKARVTDLEVQLNLEKNKVEALMKAAGGNVTVKSVKDAGGEKALAKDPAPGKP